MRVADYIMQFVAGLGVKHVFLLTGGGAMHLNDAVARCPGLQFVCNHHEQASAIGAESYSKVTKNFGVALVTTGPGGTNAITGLTGAWLDSIPMMFLSGQVKRADRMYRADGTPLGVRQRGSQEVDIVPIVRTLTKYAVTVVDPQSIRFHLEKAVYLARTGRPGPVWLDIPLDVQAISVDPDSLPGFEPPAEASQNDALPGQVREIIERLNRAERPFIFAGGGIHSSRAEREFEAATKLLRVPVGLTWLSMGLLDADDPLMIGRPGTVAPRGANFALQNCDFLLVIGARLDPPLMGWDPAHFARGAYKVAVDVDPAELAKLGRAVDSTVCADARAFLAELVRQGASIEAKDRHCWLERCEDWKKRYPVILPEHRAPGLVSVYHFAEVISQEIGAEDQIVAANAGSAIEVFLLAYRARLGQRVFHTAGLGAMGYALPASIGICVGSGGQRTICVDGDGGFQLNIQELATIARLQLPIKLFLMSNEGYASIRATQKGYFGGPNIGCSVETGVMIPDLRKIARGYGLNSALIQGQSSLRAQVRRVLRTPGPVLCDVKIIPDEARAPRVTSVQRPDGTFVSKPLEDLWPLLDRDEFRRNMIVPPLED